MKGVQLEGTYWIDRSRPKIQVTNYPFFIHSQSDRMVWNQQIQTCIIQAENMRFLSDNVGRNNVKELWTRRQTTCEGVVEEDRPKTEQRPETILWGGVQRGSREDGGVSQRIWVRASSALSSSIHDNLTVVVCRITRDSRLWVTLPAPIGRIYCQAGKKTWWCNNCNQI